MASAYSALAQRLIVATSTGELSWIDPRTDGAQAVTLALRLGHAVDDLSLFDEGRRALAVGGGRGRVIDLASAKVTLALSTVEAADTIVLTDNFAYAASARAGRATLWSLSDLRGGRNQALDVMIGSPAPQSAAACNMPSRENSQQS